MGNNQDLDDIDVFDQLDEALEERTGADRRKSDKGINPQGEDRRKGDRRQQQPAS